MLTIAFVRNRLPHQIIFPSWLRNMRKGQDLCLISLSGISLTLVLAMRETLLLRKLALFSKMPSKVCQRLCANV